MVPVLNESVGNAETGCHRPAVPAEILPDSGAETTVRIDEEGTQQLRIRFDSDTLDAGDVDYDDF